jgi:Putative phospholipid-binding domain.
MQIQTLLLGASLSALLAVNATGNAAENTVQREGNALEAKGNVREKNAVREKEAAEKTSAAGEAKQRKGEEMQKEAKSLEKNDSTAAEGARLERAGAAEKVKGEKMQESAKTHKAHAKRMQKAVGANPGVADETMNADNTKVNTRDRKDSLTPMDQSNSAAQIEVTANIRKGIMGDKTISFNGKNVKIITVGTRVTLRGPVKSSKERTAIEGIAKRTAGVSDVDNQLEIIN